MNIYKLNHKEINKLYDEFKKTNFGKRATMFSMLPCWAAVASLILFVVEDVIGGDSNIFLGLIFLNLSLAGIAMLQHLNMLKDYIQSKKDK